MIFITFRTLPSTSSKTLFRKKKVVNKKPIISNVDIVLEHLSKKQNVSPSAVDSVNMLMLSHANTIKTFSSKRQAIAKKKINDVIAELEIEQIDENNYWELQRTNHLYPDSNIMYRPEISYPEEEFAILNLKVDNSAHNNHAESTLRSSVNYSNYTDRNYMQL